MKKYMIVGVGLVAIVALFAWNGKGANETNVEQNEIASSNEVLFSSEQVIEKLQRLQIMLKAIKLPETLAFEPLDTTFSATSLLEDTIVTHHYTMDEKQEIVLRVTTQNPIKNQAEYKEIKLEKQTAWLAKAKDEIRLTMESEGLYYTLKSSVSSQEELVSMLSSLEEATFDTHMNFKELVFPTYFPSEVLTIQEVRYTKGTEESLQVTYVTKEEYGVIYTIHPAVEHLDIDTKKRWKKVKLENGNEAYYSKEDNHFMWQGDGYAYEMTSYGRELTLDEFLLMTK